MRSVRGTPTSPDMPPLVATPPIPRAAKIAPTMATTMPLRITLAPSAASQPRITLVQLVPNPASHLWRSAACSSRTAPTLRGTDSSLLSVILFTSYENQLLDRRWFAYSGFSTAKGRPGSGTRSAQSVPVSINLDRKETLPVIGAARSHLCRPPRASHPPQLPRCPPDRKSTRLNSSHANISYAVF